MRIAEYEERIFSLESENENMQLQVDELRNINESAKNELHDAIRSLQDAKKLEDDYKLLRVNYNKVIVFS